MSDVETVELEEFGKVSFSAPPPSDRDLALAANLADQQKLSVRWLHNGDAEIAASSHVGLVRFSTLEVRVVPKLVGGELRVLEMLEYAAGLDLIRRFDHPRDMPHEGRNLFDVLCGLLANEASALLRDGLIKDYRPEHDTLQVLRGRLDHRRQVLNRFGRLDQLECDFDEYDTDNPENQFITAGLLSARSKVRDHRIRREVSKAAGVFATACTPPSFYHDHYQQRIHYNRRNRRYRPAHIIAGHILRGLGFEDIYSQSTGQIFTFLLNMNEVFEQFVERLMRDVCAGTAMEVSTQERFGKVIRNLDTGRTYSNIRPDLMIRSPDGAFPVDAKYKRYDLRKLSTADIYQTFLYAYALSQGSTEPRALVMFPSDGPSPGHRLAVQGFHDRERATVTAVGIDVPGVLDSIGTPRLDEILHDLRDSLNPALT